MFPPRVGCCQSLSRDLTSKWPHNSNPDQNETIIWLSTPKTHAEETNSYTDEIV